MESSEDTTKLPTGDSDDREFLTVSVRISAEDEKLVRRAAVELDTTRSEFMADVAVRRAREVLAAQPAQRSA